MPRLSEACALLGGVAGQPTSLNRALLPPLPLNGRTAVLTGAAEFLLPLDYVGQVQLDGADVWDTAVYTATAIRQLREGDPNGAYFIRAGGGRSMVIGARGGFYDSARPNDSTLNSRFPLAVGDDGTGADCDYQNPAGIAITTMYGSPIYTINEPTRSNTDDLRAFVRGHFFSHLGQDNIWHLHNWVLQQPVPYVSVPGVQWLVPIPQPDGSVVVLERFETFLCLRRPTDTIGVKVIDAFPLYAPDARVHPQTGDLVVTYSRTPQENPEAIYLAEFNVATLDLLPRVQLDPNGPPVPEPGPGPDPTPEPEPEPEPEPPPTGEVLTVRIPKGISQVVINIEREP